MTKSISKLLSKFKIQNNKVQMAQQHIQQHIGCKCCYCIPKLKFYKTFRVSTAFQADDNILEIVVIQRY